VAKDKIEVQKVVEFFEDTDAGDRVDKVLANLARELRDFRAARTWIDTATGDTLRVVSWGTAGATETLWVEVILNETTTAYLRGYATV